MINSNGAYNGEYQTLRQEMLERFERIHDTEKYGVALFTAFMAYYFSNASSPPFPNELAFIIFQLIVTFVASYTLTLFRSIYVVGTYIAYVHESTSGIRWHRMSRQYSDWEKKKKDEKNINGENVNAQKDKGGGIRCNLLELYKAWGYDSKQFGLLIIILTLLGICAVWIKSHENPGSELYRCISSCEYLKNRCLLYFIGLGLILYNIYLTFKAFCMFKFRADCEKDWKLYLKEFGSTFPDSYVQGEKK